MSKHPNLEPSLPNNWPNPTPEDIASKPNRIIILGDQQTYAFRNNFVKTSKYETWNFLPKFLMEEFNPRTKVANCYFLLVSILQTIPQISNTFGLPTTLIPLICVVVVDGVFALLEDIGRHRADTEANSSLGLVYCPDAGTFVEKKWADMVVGDFVKIRSREKIPADVIILGVAEKSQIPQGICYVETKSLDGETNLKLRTVVPNSLGIVNETSSLKNVKGNIVMEHPNKLIDNFNGVLDLEGIGKQAMLSQNVLLRGCVLRNTDWIIGCVVNSGHDTKIMMSATGTPSKTSFLEQAASSEIQKIIYLLALVCLIGSTGATIWNSDKHVKEMWYLDWNPHPVTYFIIQYFYFFLLHATFIPVSLYVSMTLVRFFQSYFMNNDLEMYYEPTDTPSAVRTMTLNEELGQISHVFTDKTGTLTCNIMDFRKASINGVSYGQGITEIGKASWKLQGKAIPPEILQSEEKAKLASVPHVSFYDPKYANDLSKNDFHSSKIQQFFRILSLCHDTIPEVIEGEIKLSSSNPDDEALVCAATFFGFEFRDRRGKIAHVWNAHAGVLEETPVVESIVFSSKRKRMSVIIEDSNGRKQLFCKGADTAILPRLCGNQESLIAETVEHMNQYSVEGLRCLLIAYREIPDSEYHSWSARYKEASTNMKELEKRKERLPNKIEELEDEIEQQLVLVGCTAIEDKLQDGVPEAIAQISHAGVNIWVLTGDKEETAINIAVACNLVLPKEYMRHVIVNKHFCPTSEDAISLLESEIVLCQNGHNEGNGSVLPRALIIDGPSLIDIMANPLAKRALLNFSQSCRAVVGCRVSPDQKREMVHLIKSEVPGVRTLAIGDGANDVAMIQEAHIGVGIRGEEGLQATNASDYAIAQFRYLSILLLKHGRYNYLRMCSLVCYMFYKNIFMSICQFWFAWLNGFSGQKIYTEGGIQLYNLAFTSIPILLSGIYDMDVPSAAVFRHPELYKLCIQNAYFSSYVFWSWIGHAVAESLLCAYIPPLFLENSDPGNGTFNTFWESGAMTFTVVVLIVNLKMIFIQTKWMFVSGLLLVLSVLSWFAVAYFVTNFAILDYEWYQIWSHLMNNGNFWLGSLLMVVFVIGKDLYICGLQRCFYPTAPQIVQEIYLLDLQAEQASERATFPGLELQHTREVRYEAFFCRGDSQNFLNIRSWCSSLCCRRQPPSLSRDGEDVDEEPQMHLEHVYRNSKASGEEWRQRESELALRMKK